MENPAASDCEFTLLHYLQPDAPGERLKLSLLENDGSAIQRSYPFRLLDDSAPYCRVLQGAVVTDAGTVLKKVALQIQKDHYPSSSDPLRPVTNRDIDLAWQEAYAAHRDDSDAILLSSQTDRERRLVPQAPLFYCRERNQFFHPVCPSCGLPLSLCRDDDFLGKNGLAPYSTSLKRYLYCRACCRLGLQEIYLYERDHADPLSLKDRWALIERQGAVDETLDPEQALPCARCREREGCFGQEHLARTRMIPFSFYPFHMLLRSAPSLPATDFLATLAGAPPSELLQSQAPELRAGEDVTLFRPDDSRSFLEILFLKLSFLHDVLLQDAAGRGEATPVSLDRIWVTLAPLSRSLPLLWNYRVSTFDSIAPAFTATRCSGRSAHLGLIWFRTLVSSRYVTDAELLHAVVNRLALAEEDRGETPSGRLAELLVPENIFWERDHGNFPAQSLTTWEKATLLGLGLVSARPVAPQELLGPLAALLSELKGAVLATPAGWEAPPRSPRDEEVLCSVVAKLIQRYAALEECQGEAADEFEAATLILPPRPDQAAAATAAEDPMLETIIIPQATKQSAPPEAEWDEPFLETVILSPGAVPGRYPAGKEGAPEVLQEGEDLLETVLVASPRARDKRE